MLTVDFRNHQYRYDSDAEFLTNAVGIPAPAVRNPTISHHWQSRWYEEGPLKGPLIEEWLILVQIPLELALLTDVPIWSSPSLTWLTQSLRTQRLQPSLLHLVSKSSRRVKHTPETAEPVGVSPPEAVDLFRLRACKQIIITYNARCAILLA